MTQEFKVTRFAIKFRNGSGEYITGKPIYSSMAEAKEGAKKDNRAHMTRSTKAVEVDITEEVKLRARVLSYGDNELYENILQLIQYTHRGY